MLLLVMLILVFALPALADYYDGLRDWDAGRHGKALVKWQEAAGEGDARSMMALGRLFVKGLGRHRITLKRTSGSTLPQAEV